MIVWPTTSHRLLRSHMLALIGIAPSQPLEATAPAGVKWFEVDKLDVLNAKRRALEAAGASFAPGQGGPRAALAAQAPATLRTCNSVQSTGRQAALQYARA